MGLNGQSAVVTAVRGGRLSRTADRLPESLIALQLVRLDVGPAEAERLAALLCPEEQRRAARYAAGDDARRFIVRRGRLRERLGRQLGEAPGALRLVENEHGRPLDPEGRVSFNLSHSGDFALLAMARGFEVGCDLERRRAELATPEVAERFFSPAERAQLAVVPSARWVEAFFNCWTRKEALIKGLGLGVAYPLDAFDVSLFPGQPAALLRGPEGWTIRALEPLPGLHAALAFRRAAARP